MQRLDFDFFSVFFHRTHEITEVIDDVCNYIFTMNCSIKQLRKIANKNTVLYVCSSYRKLDDIVREYNVRQLHYKIYATSQYIYISTANLSLSHFPEVTIRIPRTVLTSKIIEKAIQYL